MTATVHSTRDVKRFYSERAEYLLATVLFRIALDFCYIFYINPAFETHFLTPMPVDFELLRFIASYGILILVALVLPYGKQNLSGLFFMSAIMFLLTPMSVMYGFNAALNANAMFAVVLAIVVCLLVVNTRVYLVRMPVASVRRPVSVEVAFAFVMLFVIWSVISGAAAAINFDFGQIYFFRDSASAMLDVGVMAHVNLWAQKVFNPYLLAHGLYNRNKWLIGFALLMQVYFFGVTQHRRHLFIPILIYMVYRLFASNISLARLYTYAAFATVAMLGLTLLAELDAVAAIVLRRAFFVPASVTFDWIEFFSYQPKVYFADNFLAGFSDSAYKGVSLPLFVGDYIAPGRQLAFNSGMVGAGYAQLGYAGIVLYALVLGAVVKFVNALVRQGVPIFLVAAILFAPLRTAWADSDVFTAMLSHGIIVSICLLWLSGRRKQTSLQ